MLPQTLWHPPMQTRIELYRNNYGKFEGAMNPSWVGLIDKINNVQVEGGVFGSIGEVGVHHGLFFGALASVARVHEHLWAIDLFENQHLNTDKSGKGDLNAFKQNMLLINVSTITIISGDSMKIESSEILNCCGPSRIISVDGGHSFETTLSDLFFAKSIMVERGIIILDDIFNVEWMGVISAHFQFMILQNEIVPIIYHANKLCYVQKSYYEWWVSKLKYLDIGHWASSKKTLGDHQLIHIR